MPWFYVDDGFSDSKPVLNMPDRYRLAACGLWTLAGSWSAKEETDGFVPDAKLRQLGARPPILAALVDSGSLSAPLCARVEGGIQFNSWGKWQKTRAELNEKRRTDAERQRRWREEHPDENAPRKVKGRNAVTSDDTETSRCDTDASNGVTNSVSNGVTPTRLAPDASRARARGPDPTRPDPSSSGDFEGGSHVSSSPPNDAPPPPCNRHPNGYDHDEPCRACGQIRKYDEQHAGERAIELQRAIDQQRLHAQAAINACRICDTDGHILMPDLLGDSTHHTTCPHDADEIERAKAEILAARTEMAAQ